MNWRPWLTRLTPGLLALAAVVATAGPASAVTYNLVAIPSTATMPGAVSVPMWGYALDTGQACGSNPAWAVGPKLSVPVGDGLTVVVRNCLPVPTSLVITNHPRPAPSGGPVYHPAGGGTAFPGFGVMGTFPNDPAGTLRVRSLTHEAGVGGSATYTWAAGAVKPGTFLYHSGTHAQVQVQMGLYGGVTKNSAVNQAYPEDARPGIQLVSFTKERDLFFSEIDTALHAAVAAGTYGTTGPTSTLDYRPNYFLINGKPFSPGDPCMNSLVIGDNVLLRFYNAGLRELAPMMLGSHFQLVAEGGSRLPYNYEQYSVLLQPGSTKDAVFTPTRNATFPIVERRLNLTNSSTPNGGMQTCLLVGGAPANVPPVASPQSVSTNEDTPLAITLVATDTDGPSPLTYSVSAVTPGAAGTVSGGTTASRTFTPALNYFGPASFTFTASDGAATSNVATVTITVDPINDAPTFTLGASQTVTLPAGAQTVTDWVTAISPGPANESTQTPVTMAITGNTNPAIFSAGPALVANGVNFNLTYTPSAVAGTSTITVTATDSGPTGGLNVNTSSQSRTITVNGAPGADTIFEDGFESGSFAAWTAEQDPGGQNDLQVTAGGAQAGGLKMSAIIDDTTTMWVRDDSPVSETRYRARFYFNPNSITMANNNAFRILNARSGNVNAGTDVARIEFRYSTSTAANACGAGGAPCYQVRAQIGRDAGSPQGGFANTSWFTIPNAWTHIEIDWQAATAAGADNGSISLWTAGVLRQTLSGIDNDTLRVESVRLGPSNGIDFPATVGTVLFDSFVSRRTTFIGP
jgi:FtsP/CotA-like multicopper oxidase with cupredoxin domain